MSPNRQPASPKEIKAMTQKEKRRQRYNANLENAMKRRMNELQSSLFSGARSEFRKATARLNSQQPGEETGEEAAPLTVIISVSEDRPHDFGDAKAFLCQAKADSPCVLPCAEIDCNQK